MRAIYFLFLFSPFLFSCGGESVNVPDSVIPEEKMVSLLVQMHKADAEKQVNRLHYPDSTRVDTVDYGKIFSSVGVSRAVYDSSMSFYSKHPEYLDKIYDQVIDQLNKEKLDAETSKGN